MSHTARLRKYGRRPPLPLTVPLPDGRSLEVLVDNGAARENITRHVQSRGKELTVATVDGDFVLPIR